MPIRREYIYIFIYRGYIYGWFYRGVKGAALIPVLPAYHEILGQACWVCSKTETAAKKRHTEQEMVFTVGEFKVIVETALQGSEALQSVINVKRAFNGVIGVA